MDEAPLRMAFILAEEERLNIFVHLESYLNPLAFHHEVYVALDVAARPAAWVLRVQKDSPLVEEHVTWGTRTSVANIIIIINYLIPQTVNCMTLG